MKKLPTLDLASLANVSGGLAVSLIGAQRPLTQQQFGPQLGGGLLQPTNPLGFASPVDPFVDLSAGASLFVNQRHAPVALSAQTLRAADALAEQTRGAVIFEENGDGRISAEDFMRARGFSEQNAVNAVGSILDRLRGAPAQTTAAQQAAAQQNPLAQASSLINAFRGLMGGQQQGGQQRPAAQTGAQNTAGTANRASLGNTDSLDDAREAMQTTPRETASQENFRLEQTALERAWAERDAMTPGMRRSTEDVVRTVPDESGTVRNPTYDPDSLTPAFNAGSPTGQPRYASDQDADYAWAQQQAGIQQGAAATEHYSQTGQPLYASDQDADYAYQQRVDQNLSGNVGQPSYNPTNDPDALTPAFNAGAPTGQPQYASDQDADYAWAQQQATQTQTAAATQHYEQTGQPLYASDQDADNAYQATVDNNLATGGDTGGEYY